MTMEDIFASFGDIFGDAFGGLGGFGGGRRGGRRVNKGSNLRVKVKLTLREVANGAEKKIKVNKYVACKSCGGTGAADSGSVTTCTTCHGSGHVTRVTNTFLGQMQTSSVCPTCGGEGKTITRKCTVCYGEGIVQGEEVIKINIPAGVGKGMQMTVSGKGNEPRRGGVAGDLLVLLMKRNTPLVER
jgi:molecular chaperone DnaJ